MLSANQPNTPIPQLPMITLLLLTYLIMTVAGCGIVLHAVVWGPVGFEDELGYHSAGATRSWEFAFAFSGADVASSLGSDQI
jgi:hypothetical protein